MPTHLENRYRGAAAVARREKRALQRARVLHILGWVAAVLGWLGLAADIVTGRFLGPLFPILAGVPIAVRMGGRPLWRSVVYWVGIASTFMSVVGLLILGLMLLLMVPGDATGF